MKGGGGTNGRTNKSATKNKIINPMETKILPGDLKAE